MYAKLITLQSQVIRHLKLFNTCNSWCGKDLYSR